MYIIPLQFIQCFMNKKTSKPIMKKAREQMADSLKLPKDFICGASITSITGCEEAFVENYKGIIEYNKNCIKIQTKVSRVTFLGKDLEIVYCTNVDMKITGEMDTITYS